MNTTFNKIILKLCFCAFALIALSACGGGSSGGGNNTTPEPTCDNALNFCDTPDKIVRADCDSAAHNCTTGARIPLDLPSIDAATPGNPDATVIYVTPPTDTPEAFLDTDYVTRAAYTAPDAAMEATNVNRERYKSTYDDGTTDDTDETEEIPNDATIATAVAGIQANSEYQRSRHADEINAAYAYARGYSGAGITVSIMGYPISRSHFDLNGQTVQGYTADDGETGSEGGGCMVPDDAVCIELDTSKGTHLAGIIVGRQNSFGMQGIAYDARLKPIDILSGDVSPEQLNAAIGEASGSDITVMNNGWNDSGVGTFIDTDEEPDLNVFYRTANKISTINTAERTAWKKAVETTVVVFPRGIMVIIVKMAW